MNYVTKTYIKLFQPRSGIDFRAMIYDILSTIRYS